MVAEWRRAAPSGGSAPRPGAGVRGCFGLDTPVNTCEHRQVPYQALLTFTFDTADNNAYQRMQTALLGLGWTYAETAAFVYHNDEQPDEEALVAIWKGIEAVARGSQSAGRVTSLNYTIQFVDTKCSSKTQLGATSPENAVRSVMQSPLPR